MDAQLLHFDGEQLGVGIGGGNLTSDFSLVENDMLYSMAFRDGHPCFSVGNVMHVDGGLDHVPTWYYFGDWAVLLRSSGGRAGDVNLYHKTTIFDDFVHVCRVPDLLDFMIPTNLDSNISATVFDGVLHIQIQMFEVRTYPYRHNHLINHISRYNIRQLQWLPSISFPFSPIDDVDEGLGHALPSLLALSNYSLGNQLSFQQNLIHYATADFQVLKTQVETRCFLNLALDFVIDSMLVCINVFELDFCICECSYESTLFLKKGFGILRSFGINVAVISVKLPKSFNCRKDVVSPADLIHPSTCFRTFHGLDYDSSHHPLVHHNLFHH
ncbi:hypothetical protein Tco_0853682 [Tanacetum coccineum]